MQKYSSANHSLFLSAIILQMMISVRDVFKTPQMASSTISTNPTPNALPFLKVVLNSKTISAPLANMATNLSLWMIHNSAYNATNHTKISNLISHSIVLEKLCLILKMIVMMLISSHLIKMLLLPVLFLSYYLLFFDQTFDIEFMSGILVWDKQFKVITIYLLFIILLSAIKIVMIFI